MVVKDDHEVSIHRQCELLQICRSGVYYKPVPTREEELKLMIAIDKLHLKDPTLGTRRIPKMLEAIGYKISCNQQPTMVRKW